MRLNRVVRLLLVMVCLMSGFALFAQADPPIPANTIRIHYFRPDGVYTGWTVYAYGDTTEPNDFGSGPVAVTNIDSFGAYFDVGVTAGAQNVGIIIHNGNNKDPGPDEFADPATQGHEYWQISGVHELYATQPSIKPMKNPNIPANTARIHFFRPDNNYAGWTVYAFYDTTADTGNYNGGPIQVTGSDTYGVYYDVPLIPNPQDLGFIVHNINTGTKNTPADLHLDVALDNEAWIISGDPMVYVTLPTPQQLLNANFLKLQAFWIDRTTVAIQQVYAFSGSSYKLLSDPAASLQLTANGVTGGTSVALKAGGTLSVGASARLSAARGIHRFEATGEHQAGGVQVAAAGAVGGLGDQGGRDAGVRDGRAGCGCAG